MPGLTAKVFRTYNASDTLQQKLPGEAALAGLSVAEKVCVRLCLCWVRVRTPGFFTLWVVCVDTPAWEISQC